MELHCLKEQQHLLVFLLSSLRCTDLIWAIQTVVMSITSQAGWHTPSAGTDILVDGAWRDYWRRTEYISQHLTVLFFFSGRTSPSRDLLSFSFQKHVEAKKIKNTQKKKKLQVLLTASGALGENVLERVTAKYVVLQVEELTLWTTCCWTKCSAVLGE